MAAKEPAAKAAPANGSASTAAKKRAKSNGKAAPKPATANGRTASPAAASPTKHKEKRPPGMSKKAWAEIRQIKAEIEAMKVIHEGRPYRRMPDGVLVPEEKCYRDGDVTMDKYYEADFSDNEEFFVEEILSCTQGKHGDRQFRVKWGGYEIRHDELTDFSGLVDLVLLDLWEEQHPRSKLGEPAVAKGCILPS